MNNEKREMIKVLIIEPNKEPYVAEIENHYQAMQEIVGGSIELQALPDGECHFYCNDEGKIHGLPGNRRMDNDDIICGTFFICSSNGYGDDISLTDKQIERYTERFQTPEVHADNEAHSFKITVSSASSIDEFLKMMGFTPQGEDFER